MTSDNLSALIARLEAATGADRELDTVIWLATTPGATRKETVVPPNNKRRGWTIDETRDASHHLIIVPSYTASIDAALTLLPSAGEMTLVEVSFSWEQNDLAVWPAITVRWYPPHKSGPDWHAMIESAATLPLTICIAALKARTTAPTGEHTTS